jgi:crotonobetainyl-CoA:carnitine CoA-transferase CaiB-like acyl-CoA transferase
MPPSLPLAGIRIIEFSHMVMGPTSGLILGDLGADVIKIEPMGDGDNTRRLAGSGAGFFITFNRNKRSVGVDIKSKDGLAFIHRLVSTADALTENFRPGALEALGLGAEALTKMHPHLIYCSLKGFLTGPYEHRTALDEVVQMMGGLAYMTGPPGRPLRAGTSVNDIMGGMFAVIGILAALQQRHRTGRGQVIKSGLFENNMLLVAQHMAQFAVTGKAAAPMPERISAWAVYDVFETKDNEQVFLGVVSDSQWATFCAEYRLETLKADPRLQSNRDRVAERGWMIPELRRLLLDFTLADILATAERLGLPYAPISRPEDLFTDPHLNHPGAMVEVTMADGRKAPVPALPLEWGGERFGMRLDIPKAGEHGATIAREIGYSESEIDAMIRSGALQAG